MSPAERANKDAHSPDLTPEGLAPRDAGPVSVEDVSPQGVATFGICPVLSHSTKYLPHEDIDAVTAYLTEGMPDAAAQDISAIDAHPAGHRTYLRQRRGGTTGSVTAEDVSDDPAGG